VISVNRKGVILALILVCTALMRTTQLSTVTTSRDGGTPLIDLDSEKELVEKAHSLVRSQFYENIGQIDNDDLMFYGKVQGGVIGFGESRVYLWQEGENGSVILSFCGAKCVAPKGVDEVSHRTNYFLGDQGTYTGVRGFSCIVYDNLWFGVSLVYRSTAAGAKYEFRLAPGADPADIKVQCEGHDCLVIGVDSVRIETNKWAFMDEGLKVFQNRREIEAEFMSCGPESFGVLIGDYDRSEALVIDPLLYSTFVGGSEEDCGEAIAVDSSGNAYVAGNTRSSDFPTVNGHDSSHNGVSDCFVFKLSSTGDSLLYSTFVSGSGYDRGASIAVDSSGNAYVTGETQSSDFPTINAYDSSHNGTEDCFVFKLSPTGDSLLYSTFVGGSDWDQGASIAVDSSGNAYVAGETESSDFPTVNAYDDSHNGSYDCFVFKLSSTGDSLLYSTFVGGSSYDHGASIAVDSSGSAYVTGYTDSSDFPAVNAYDSSHDSYSDCFVFKLSATGDSLLYSTFVGGSHNDHGASIAVDSSGNAYVTGQTSSSDFPTVNAYDSSQNGYGDCFVFSLSATGDSLLYSTFVGGSNHDRGASIAVDSSGSAYVTGGTKSSNFPTVNAYNTWADLVHECFVLRLSATGDSLLYSTFVGGRGYGYGYGSVSGYSIAVDPSGNAYVTGYTSSSDFPTVNAYDDSYNGYSDCFVFILSDTSDSDVDGLSRYEESLLGTDPNDADTDDDGMPDGWEVSNSFDPLADDASGDADTDGLTNLEEYRESTDPHYSDSDDDGLSDGDEVNLHGSNPLDSDSDDDGMSDEWEVNNGYDPTNSAVALTQRLHYNLPWVISVPVLVVAFVVGRMGLARLRPRIAGASRPSLTTEPPRRSEATETRRHEPRQDIQSEEIVYICRNCGRPSPPGRCVHCGRYLRGN
jgi:hypothetical protein